MTPENMSTTPAESPTDHLRSPEPHQATEHLHPAEPHANGEAHANGDAHANGEAHAHGEVHARGDAHSSSDAHAHTETNGNGGASAMHHRPAHMRDGESAAGHVAALLAEVPDLSEELAFAERVAREAATIVNTFYIGSSEVRYKTDDEPVTEADRSANLHILARLQARYPDDGVLSEESKDDLSRLKKQRVWIVDPLDGTKEFIARNGEFSIMIGLAIGGKPLLGVVMQPATGLLYAGALGLGAYLLEDDERVPLVVSEVNQISRMVLVSSRSHRQQIVDRMRKVMKINTERTSGSVGLKVGLIARELADLYVHPSPGCKEWDLCAPHAILEAAGGRMTDCWGNPLRYNKRDVRAHNGLVASNNTCHDEIVAQVAEICEEFGFNEDDGFW